MALFCPFEYRLSPPTQARIVDTSTGATQRVVDRDSRVMRIFCCGRPLSSEMGKHLWRNVQLARTCSKLSAAFRPNRRVTLRNRSRSTGPCALRYADCASRMSCGPPAKHFIAMKSSRPAIRRFTPKKGTPTVREKTAGSIPRSTPDRPVDRERERANYGVVDLLALQDFDYIEEQERGLTRPIGPHALNVALRTRCASAARPAWCRAPSN